MTKMRVRMTNCYPALTQGMSGREKQHARAELVSWLQVQTIRTRDNALAEQELNERRDLAKKYMRAGVRDYYAFRGAEIDDVIESSRNLDRTNFLEMLSGAFLVEQEKGKQSPDVDFELTPDDLAALPTAARREIDTFLAGQTEVWRNPQGGLLADERWDRREIVKKHATDAFHEELEGRMSGFDLPTRIEMHVEVSSWMDRSEFVARILRSDAEKYVPMDKQFPKYQEGIGDI